ncbi:helix-turn-helix transcriptional regulator [Kitasatospora sp. NA04385]|uniref:helix-turn-helix domain-containing protein n=1 Tax=Kitasatospora sp. NA04385 TaxID=2742135 RepID=UPI001591D2E0|nr:helix-turn-helix domain-containing protein [Kitasatospora sp. NA04385]QKW18627.1 helix-turn-helix transcriptional regulator [Kitasatospora sp. NA04385]
MARWDPNARGRLERAALELFVRQGYDRTTVAEIAERAGLAKSTFFRHFADKREVLSGGDALARLLTGAVAAAPPGAGPRRAAEAALAAAGAQAFTAERHGTVRERQQVVAANPELTERELLKREALATALTGALRERGVPEQAAVLTAELTLLALRTALARWTARPGQDFTALALTELAALCEAATAL